MVVEPLTADALDDADKDEDDLGAVGLEFPECGRNRRTSGGVARAELLWDRRCPGNRHSRSRADPLPAAGSHREDTMREIILMLVLAACAAQQAEPPPPPPPPPAEELTITVAVSVPARLVEMVADFVTKDEVLGYFALAKGFLLSDDDD
jgi:hypothetical protein